MKSVFCVAIFLLFSCPSIAQELASDSIASFNDELPNFQTYHVGFSMGVAFMEGIPSGDFRLFGTRRMTQYFMPGIGTGIDYYHMMDYNLVPVYLNVRGHVNESNSRPFYNVRVGKSFPVKRKHMNYESRTGNGGLFFGGEIGVRTGKKRFHMVVALGYKYQKATETEQQWWEAIPSERRMRINRITFRIGVGI